MTLEIKAGHELPKEVLEEKTKDMFFGALSALRENQGLKDALLNRFLLNPQGKGFSFRSGQLEFESKGTNFILNLERDSMSDRLTLSTFSEGIEEHVSLWLTYNEKSNESCTLLEGVERGEIFKVVMAFRKTDWYGAKPAEMQVNSSEAEEKVRQFLHQI